MNNYLHLYNDNIYIYLVGIFNKIVKIKDNYM